MARYPRYRRTYFKRVYPRKRWGSCIKTSLVDVTINPGSTDGYAYNLICENTVDNTKPNPTPIKFGRFKLKGDIRVSNNAAIGISTCMLYIVFVPQGSTIDDTLVMNHPEYLLGWTCLSMNSGNSFSLTSSLKRNLNSGDRIAALFVIDTLTQPTASVTFAIVYNIQYWVTSG